MMNGDNILVLRQAARRYRASTASGEWVWVGTAKEIVAQMTILDFDQAPGTLNSWGYMRRVQKRIRQFHGIHIEIEQGRYLKFLRELENIGFLSLTQKP